MFGFFKKRAPEPPPLSRSASQISTLLPGQDFGCSISSTDVRVELVRTVLKDTMRAHGLPSGWLRAEVDSLSKGNGPLHIRITMTQWSGTLLKYTMALERVILTGLDRYDPAVDHSGYTVSWQFAKDCVCPFPTLPAPDSWVKKTSAPTTMAPAPAPVPSPAQTPIIAATSDFLARQQRARPAPRLNPERASNAYADTTLSPP